MIVEKNRLNGLLPATPVSPSMEERIRAIAKDSNVSVAHVQRAAFEFFLSIGVSKPDINDSNIEVKEGGNT